VQAEVEALRVARLTDKKYLRSLGKKAASRKREESSAALEELLKWALEQAGANAARRGLGRIVATHHPSPTSYQVR
jgi:hypothetical protein